MKVRVRNEGGGGDDFPVSRSMLVVPFRGATGSRPLGRGGEGAIRRHFTFQPYNLSKAAKLTFSSAVPPRT